jgi:hypothetical protein
VQHPADTAGAEGELEEPLRHHQLRIGELPAGRRTQVEPVADVHRDAVGAEQVRDAGDRRLQRVRQRELGDRLAHDLEERLRVLKLERRLPGALARTKRLRRADGKGAELLQLGWRRRDARWEDELEHTEWWLPQAERRHRSARAVRQGLEPDRLPFVRHEAGLRGGRGHRLRRATRHEELERTALTRGPEQRGLGSRRQSGDADDLFGAARLVEPGSERVARERQAGVGSDRAHP